MTSRKLQTYGDVNNGFIYPYSFHEDAELVSALQKGANESGGMYKPGVGYSKDELVFFGPPGYPTFKHPTGAKYPTTEA